MSGNETPDSRMPENEYGDDQQLEYVLAEYVDRINRGETVDPSEVITRYPDLAGEILRELETAVREVLDQLYAG